MKRPPRGFDPEHPQIDDLKRKDFVLVRSIPRRSVTSGSFLKDYAGMCRQAGPFVNFLTDSLGQRF